jgi:hypothetical protein
MPAKREIDMSDAAELDEQQRHWFEVFQNASNQANYWKGVADQAKAELKDTFTNATALVDGKPAFQVVRSSVRKLDQRYFKSTFPELYEKCIVQREQSALYLIQEEAGD